MAKKTTTDESRKKMEAARRVTDAAVKSGQIKKKKERLNYKPPVLSAKEKKARADRAAAKARAKEAGTAPGQVKEAGRKVSKTAKKMQSFLKSFGS